MTEFSQCSQGDKYFAKENHFRRTLERNFDKLKGAFTDKDEPLEQTPETVAVQKQMDVALKISKAWVKAEGFDKHVLGEFNNAKHFCAMEPKANLPLPIWLAKLALEHSVEACRNQQCRHAETQCVLCLESMFWAESHGHVFWSQCSVFGVCV